MCSVGLHLLSAVSVRMARTGFSAIDIYLYTDGVTRDCGAFSCACVGVLVVCVVCMYGCIKVCFVSVWWCIYVSMHLYNVLVACVVVVWCWRSVRVYG